MYTQHLGPFYFVIRHMIFLGLGVALAIFMARTELELFERNAFLLLLLAIGLLLLVFVPGLGVRINGARRWIRLGILGFQSVEAVKLLFIVYLASYLVRHQEAVQSTLFGILKPLGVAVVLVALLLLQPDFGSSALIIAVAVGMVWLGGARMRNLVYLAVPLLPDRLDRDDVGLPRQAPDLVPQSVGAPVRRGLPADPGPDRDRGRGEWLQWRRPRRFCEEAAVSARGAHRFHPRRDRRRIRVHRQPARARNRSLSSSGAR